VHEIPDNHGGEDIRPLQRSSPQTLVLTGRLRRYCGERPLERKYRPLTELLVGAVHPVQVARETHSARYIDGTHVSPDHSDMLKMLETQNLRGELPRLPRIVRIEKANPFAFGKVSHRHSPRLSRRPCEPRLIS
jgi:hypothetical protein